MPKPRTPRPAPDRAPPPRALRALACALLASPLLLLGPPPAEAQPQGRSQPRPPAVAPAPEVSLLGTATPPPPPRRGPRRAAHRTPGPTEPAFQAYTNDPSFRLNNRSGIEVHEIYVSPPSERNWGRDRLGEDVLRAGRFTTIRLPEGQCVNDVRVVFADGQALELREVNTCALTDLAFP